MQKFHNGDLVRVAKDLGPCMSHFSNDCDAIVKYSYEDKYGGPSCNPTYGIFIKGKGTSAWYDEHQLTLIESGRHDLLREWEEKRDADIEQKKDLDWIFEHGDEVLDKKYGASAEALAACFGVHNLWGSSGEGFIYYENKVRILDMAYFYLRNKNKQGWLNYCKYKKEEDEREVRSLIAMIDILTDNSSVQKEEDNAQC
jgi:hypothetical protein